MYTLIQKETKGLHFIEISDSKNTSKAILCLNQGGRLSGLKFGGFDILADFEVSTYEKNYASSILFPFANRIKDGKYTFEGNDYTLNCNEAEQNNALHGLVYDKMFKLVDDDMNSSFGSATLQYTHNGTAKGFPFKFQIELTYKLAKENLSLSVQIVNQDTKTFPFVIGWHPYFASENLDKSTLKFESNTQFLVDQQQIISGATSLDITMPYQLKGVKLDDGYQLESNAIAFLTPDYRIEMSSNSNENYLQLYTPETPNSIAIEPMTGANDSFNNKIGLQTLNPYESYTVKWTIAFKNRATKLKLTN